MIYKFYIYGDAPMPNFAASTSQIAIYMFPETDANTDNGTHIANLDHYAAPFAQFIKVSGYYNVAVTGGGIKFSPEQAKSTVIKASQLPAAPVIVKTTGTIEINLEPSGSRTFTEVVYAVMRTNGRSTGDNVVIGTTCIGGGCRVKQTTGVTIADNGDGRFKVTTTGNVFASASGAGQAVALDRPVRYQWLMMRGWDLALDENNTMIQIDEIIDANNILVKQPLLVGTQAGVKIAGSMVRTGVPRQTYSIDAIDSTVDKPIGDRKFSTFSIVQDTYGVENPYVYTAKGIVPQAFALTVNSHAIITSTSTFLASGIDSHDYEEEHPVIVDELKLRSYPSISSATEQTRVYVDGIAECVKDFSLTLSDLATETPCIGHLSATGMSLKAYTIEVKATEYLGRNPLTLKHIYDFVNKTWTPRNYTVTFADITGNYFAFTVFNTAITGEVPAPGTDVAELPVTGSPGGYVDMDMFPPALGGSGKTIDGSAVLMHTTANEIEKTEYALQFDYIPASYWD